LRRSGTNSSRYDLILEHIFEKHHKPGVDRFEFIREELNEAADSLQLARVLNLGDLLYSYRYRRALPPSIEAAAPAGFEWVIESVIARNTHFGARESVESFRNPTC
jgi:hypothetical protein